MTRPIISMRQAIETPDLLGSAMPRTPGGADTWLAWRALAIALNGEALTAEELAAFQKLTGRQTSPEQRVEEVAILKGRRSGGTTFCAAVTVYQAAMVDYSTVLGVGERATALLLAPSQRQAQIAFNRVAGIIDASPLLSSMVVGRTADLISLANHVDIEVRAASFRSLRGLSLCCAVADEGSYFMQEGANTDAEILASIRPALATTRGLLLIASTPYSRSGELYELHERHYGREGDPVLVARGTSRDTNPSLPESVIARALERDPVAARAEFLGEFRMDVAGFIGRELLLRAVDPGVTERPAVPGVEYVTFTDAASGIASSGDGDRFAVAVGHLEGETVIIDLVRRWLPPFNASEITGEVAIVAKTYGCSEVVSDGFSSGFLRAELARHGVGHRISEFSKSELYLASLPMLTSGRVRLPDVSFLVDEFASLERRPGAGGHDKVDNFRGHEDSANTASAVIATLSASKPAPGWGVFEFYRKQAEALTKAEPTHGVAEHFGYSLAAREKMPIVDVVRIVWPPNSPAPSRLEIGGTGYLPRTEGEAFAFYVKRDDARALLKGPFPRADVIAANQEIAAGLEPLPREPAGITVTDALDAMRPQSIAEFAMQAQALRVREAERTIRQLRGYRR